MKKFAVLFVAMAFAATAYGAPFTDVPRTHWAYDAIQKAVAAGVLQGYDGKFDGQRLLNRYQMAVITAKLLEKVQAGGGATMGAPEDLKKMIANLEALTIEFADELALLNVKVSTLEDTVKELQGGRKAPVAVAQTGEIGFTAFASFALVSTDDMAAVGGTGVRTRYGNADSLFFTMPQVSMGVDKEVNPGVFFHAQFDYASEINGAGGAVTINEAYFFLDEMFGDIGGKMGTFALPMSMEHNGPFRTCNLTITPSAINSALEQIRPYGLELQKTKDVQPGDINWKFGIVSGTDFGIAPFTAAFFNDFPADAVTNAQEFDDGFGFYIYIGKKPERTGQFGWNLSYLSNGGDDTAAAPAIASPEVDFFNLGFEWSNDDILVLIQYLSGNVEQGLGLDNDFDSFYLLFNYKVDEKQSISLRYDDWSIESNLVGGGVVDEGNAITFAFNRKVTDNSMFQFEYITVDADATAPANDEDDDLLQFRYKVHF